MPQHSRCGCAIANMKLTCPAPALKLMTSRLWCSEASWHSRPPSGMLGPLRSPTVRPNFLYNSVLGGRPMQPKLVSLALTFLVAGVALANAEHAMVTDEQLMENLKGSAPAAILENATI